MPSASRPDLDRWAKRIKSPSERTHRKLDEELSTMGGELPALLEDLSRYPSGVVRGWVAWVAPKLLGRAAVPILQRLATDRNYDARDTARASLEDLGDEFVPPLFPRLRLDLKRGKDVFGTGKFAMMLLARHRDPEAPPVLRKYAEHFDRGHYGYRMPNVLADYIEDARSLARRITDHDHEWMFWLVEAADILHAPDADEAFEAALNFDVQCADIVRDRPSIKYRTRKAD